MERSHSEISREISYAHTYMYFDDYETWIGSHSGIHKLGAVYITLQSIPRKFRSNLENISLAMLLHHDDHKKIGNRVAFARLISELS